MSETPKPKRGRPQTLDTEKVLNVAMEAYWKGDPADVSVNAICGMADASKPAIYRAFGSEDGLMLAALNRYADEVLFDIFQVFTPETSLKDTLNALIQFSSQDPKVETGCLFYKMRAGKHRLGPQTLQRINEVDTLAVETFAAYLEQRRA
ncbi:MAG: TetR/AcrR family transcriptional regulator, partial [Sulfitobacter sp.]